MPLLTLVSLGVNLYRDLIKLAGDHELDIVPPLGHLQLIVLRHGFYDREWWEFVGKSRGLDRGFRRRDSHITFE